MSKEAPKKISSSTTEEEIRQRAYEIWKTRNGEGDAINDWNAAIESFKLKRFSKQKTKKSFELKQEIAVGDLLTSASILISILALFFSWSQSHILQEREQANRVRNAAAQTLAKLERWQQISLSLFDEIQPDIVETSELLANNRSPAQTIKARDYLYKKLRSSRLNLQKDLRQEEIETAYVYLYSYHPSLRKRFQNVLTNLETKENEMFEQLLSNTEGRVLSWHNSSKPYETSFLGNPLRADVTRIKKSYEAKLKKILQPIATDLTNLVIKSDSQILNKENLQNLYTDSP